MSHESDKVVSGLICERDLAKIREAVCIQVEKIYDSCKEKDCVENARVYFRDPCKVERLIHKAINVKARKAKVIDVYADIEEVPFKEGFYTVDVKFFILVTLDFFVPCHTGGTKIITKKGLVVFDKKVILFGSEGGVKIFKSKFDNDSDHPYGSSMQQDNLPIAKVEVADPIALNAKFIEVPVLQDDDDFFDLDKAPKHVLDSIDEGEEFGDDVKELLVDSDRGEHIKFKKVVVATIGLFSIVKLARYVQLLIPAFDFCVPHKVCIASTNDDPCEIFETIDFPINEFFPPQINDFPGAEEAEEEMYEHYKKHHHHDHDHC